MQRFDLIVIGSGSGLDVAWAASQAGWSAAVVERGALGGTCLNCGCIPSKMLIHSADVVETIKNARQFGVNVGGYSVDFPSIVGKTERLVDGESRRIEEALRDGDNPRLFKGTGRFVGEKTVQVGSETIEGKRVLIATGTRPRVPEIEGLKEAGFITSTEALRLKVQPKVLTIIGGGYIAAELAHFFGSLGTEINIVQRGRLLIANEDEEVAEAFTDIWRSKYNLYMDSEPVEVARDGEAYSVTIRSAKGKWERVLNSDRAQHHGVVLHGLQQGLMLRGQHRKERETPCLGYCRGKVPTARRPRNSLVELKVWTLNGARADSRQVCMFREHHEVSELCGRDLDHSQVLLGTPCRS